jgi:tetratricopeptide (TPR) repeat protein
MARQEEKREDSPREAPNDDAKPTPVSAPKMAAMEPTEEESAQLDEAPPPPSPAPPASGAVDMDGKGMGMGGGEAAGPTGGMPGRSAGSKSDKDAFADGTGLDGEDIMIPEPEPEAVVMEKPADPSSFADDLVDQRGLAREQANEVGFMGAVGGQEHDLEGNMGSGSGYGSSRSKNKKSGAYRKPKVVSPIARNEKQPCSDASARSLAQRKILWEQRLERTPDMLGRLRTYENAAASCELENWPQQRVFLQLLQAGVATEAEIELLLAHFGFEREAQSFLARALLRRLVDPALIGAVERSMWGGTLDWQAIDEEAARATSATAALDIVDLALAKHVDASEDERLPLELLRIDLLFELTRIEEAIAAGRKLRERGLITPMLAQQLGELLVSAGQPEEAKRVFSEIVEYDPEGQYTRRLLGDIFLRQGWYQEAYRQYQDLVSLTGDPSDVIRMARAAAGAGRVDEGLRLLRKVASGEGRPGVDDPRRFARLHAAVLIAEMLASDASLPKDKLEAELERLQLFDAPTTWTLVTWTDLEHGLTLGVEPVAESTETGREAEAANQVAREAARKAALRISDGRSAGNTGLWAIQADGLDDLIVRHRGEVPTRAVSFQRLTIHWDGHHFEVVRTLGTIAAKAAREGEEEAVAEGDAEASAP